MGEALADYDAQNEAETAAAPAPGGGGAAAAQPAVPRYKTKVRVRLPPRALPYTDQLTEQEEERQSAFDGQCKVKFWWPSRPRRATGKSKRPIDVH